MMKYILLSWLVWSVSAPFLSAYASTSEALVLTRQNALFQKMDIIAQNIANANTEGYQEEMPLFTHTEGKSGIAYAGDYGMVRNLKQGELKATSSPFDVAISGRGYFMLQYLEGVAYSRVGHFRLNEEGILVNLSGYPVLNEAGQPIAFPENFVSFAINQEGDIHIDEELLDRIAVVNVEDERLMRKKGQGILITDQAALPAMRYALHQGMIELSNVSSMRTMARMMATSRAVGSTSKVLSAMHDMELSAIREITKTP